MRLAVDLRVLDAPGMERSGIGRYALELVRALPRVRPGWELIVHTNRPELLENAVVRRTRWPTSGSPGRAAWLRLGSTGAADAWFSPAYALPLRWRGPAAVTVHDLTFLLERERYRGRPNAWHASSATRSATRRAGVVLCGARATAELLREHLGVPAKRIAVTPYGISEVFRSAPAEAGRGRELLFVGTFEARKGLDVLLEAWRRLARDDLGLRLAGAPGWGAESELAALAALPRVQVERSPSDERLAELYRGAAALVHPSRMEGFGLPVAEAMASACPVVSSDLPSVREYAGDAVRFVPRGDAAALAAALGEVMDDAPARRGMAERGRDAVTGLTWEATAEGTAAAIEAAAGGSA